MTPSDPARARVSLLLDGLTLLVLCAAIGWFVLGRRGSVAAPPPVVPGLPDSTFVSFAVTDPAGRRSTLAPDPGSRGLLLLVFKSDCPACGIQKSEWLRLAAVARARNVEVIGLTLEELTPAVQGYFADSRIGLARIAEPAAALAALHTTIVPATIFVTDRGRIAFHALGLLDPAGTRRLEGLL
jgi:hypothetical protein